MKYLFLYLFLLPITLLAAPPNLTVVVVVDGFTAANMQALQTYFAPGGLKTMGAEGIMLTFGYPHLVFGGNETVATLVTGTTPNNHTIIADRYYNRAEHRTQSILEDTKQKGINTTLCLSPKSVLATTLTDEMRMNYGIRSKIYAIGIDPITTILLAGHGANACCWFNAEQKKWATTNYYSKGLLVVADRKNVSGEIEKIYAEQWLPLMSIPLYEHPSEKEIKESFRYLNKNVICNSPAMNRMVLRLAEDLLQEEQLGKDNIPDMLLLQLTLISPASTSDDVALAEQEDMYLNLNQDLTTFLSTLNTQIGKNNYRIVMIGKPTKGRSDEKLKLANIEPKNFSLDRAVALTATYLSALYGNKRWIEGKNMHSIFLNHALIEQEKKSLATMRQQVADFLLEFDGIKMAYPTNQICSDEINASVCNKKMGDVFFLLQDNWHLYANEKLLLDNVVESNPISPIIFWGAGFKPDRNEKINATDIKNILLK